MMAMMAMMAVWTTTRRRATFDERALVHTPCQFLDAIEPVCTATPFFEEKKELGISVGFVFHSSQRVYRRPDSLGA